jgi:hypothetical protein
MVMEVFPNTVPASQHTVHQAGRALLIRCVGPLGGPPPEDTIQAAKSAHARIIIVDAMPADYADSDGLRWLLMLRAAAIEQHIEVRIAAREGSNIWRNLLLLRAGFPLYANVQAALHGPPQIVSSPGRKEAAYV